MKHTALSASKHGGYGGGQGAGRQPPAGQLFLSEVCARQGVGADCLGQPASCHMVPTVFGTIGTFLYMFYLSHFVYYNMV